MEAVKFHWQMSESNERYTPAPIVGIARRTFEDQVIDLDPASNSLANIWIGARRIFTPEEDGLARSWSGRVWVNPPYGWFPGTSRSSVDVWAEKSLQELRRGRVTELAFLCGAHHMGLEFIQRLIAAPTHPTAVCFLKDRVKFLRIPENKIGTAEDLDDVEVMDRPSFNNVLFYVGDNVGRFMLTCHGFGSVMVSDAMVWERPAEFLQARDQWMSGQFVQEDGQLSLGVELRRSANMSSSAQSTPRGKYRPRQSASFMI